MGRRYPYQRFLQIDLTLLEQLRYAPMRAWWRLQRWFERLWHSKLVWRWIGEPLHDRKFAPWATYSPEAKAPVVTSASQIGCRTRHGVAVVHWSCFRSAPSPNRARKVLLPDGTRGDVQNRTTGQWRREGRGEKLWILGDVDIRADDVTFIDAVSQDLNYEPPSADCLERDLALHRPFVEALADDKFAIIAHHMLAQLEWMRIGARETGWCDNLHGMIPGLRNKGEDYLDYKHGWYGITLTDTEKATHARRMNEIMRSLGWRTYTADELDARTREDFRARVARRLEAWRGLDAYEARPAHSHDVLAVTPLVADMALYEGDDAEWLEELRGEERAAASSQFVQQLKDLASSGRVTEDEYRELFECLL